MYDGVKGKNAVLQTDFDRQMYIFFRGQSFCTSVVPVKLLHFLQCQQISSHKVFISSRARSGETPVKTCAEFGIGELLPSFKLFFLCFLEVVAHLCHNSTSSCSSCTPRLFSNKIKLVGDGKSQPSGCWS